MTAMVIVLGIFIAIIAVVVYKDQQDKKKDIEESDQDYTAEQINNQGIVGDSTQNLQQPQNQQYAQNQNVPQQPVQNTPYSNAPVQNYQNAPYPQYNQNPVPQTYPTYSQGQATKPSQIVVGIAVAMLIFFIGGALACFIAASNISNDEAQMIVGIFGGYVLFQGAVIFGVLFGIGQILKNNEEINETTEEIKEANKEMNSKIDMIIKKL